METVRKRLIANLWPDKLLYGAVTLLVVGVTGIVWALLVDAGEIRYGVAVPGLVASYPAEVTLAASAATIALAAFALARRATPWGFAGALTGMAALGFLGLGSVLSVLALVFFALSRMEGEEKNPQTVLLTPDLWPDKSLAAALLSVVNGVLSVAWGVALASGQVSLPRLGDAQATLGGLAVAAGLLALAAGMLLYYQRAPVVAVVAAVGCLAVLSFVVVGPVLSIGTLVLVAFAVREGEFRPGAQTASAAAIAGQVGTGPR